MVSLLVLVLTRLTVIGATPTFTIPMLHPSDTLDAAGSVNVVVPDTWNIFASSAEVNVVGPLIGRIGVIEFTFKFNAL
jgi:hypothetical protein